MSVQVNKMATLSPLRTPLARTSLKSSGCCALPRTSDSRTLSCNSKSHKNQNKRTSTVVAAIGDVSSEGTTYLIAGAATVALLGTAFPIVFARKDICPECDGAGFIRKSGGALRANAARKDQPQIVCPNCNGLGKLNQVDK